MPSQRIVRCEIARRPADPPSVRYIPLEVFGLWEHLMTARHGFTVRARQASLWIDAMDTPEIRAAEKRFDDVTELTLFLYSDSDGMFSRVTRYLPQDGYDGLRDILLGHYASRLGAGEMEPQIRERPGVWIRRNGADD